MISRRSRLRRRSKARFRTSVRGQKIANAASVLEAAGATAKNVVNMRVILRDTADFPRFNDTFRDYMAGEKVTRTCVGGTPHRAGINVEIDCVAMFD